MFVQLCCNNVWLYLHANSFVYSKLRLSTGWFWTQPKSELLKSGGRSQVRFGPDPLKTRPATDHQLPQVKSNQALENDQSIRSKPIKERR